jgi:hypothetical protein
MLKLEDKDHDLYDLPFPLKSSLIFSQYFHPSISLLIRRAILSFDLGLEDTLEGDGIGSKLGDTLTELLNSHLVLVEVEAEEGLVRDVCLLLDVEGMSGGSIQLLGDRGVRVEEILEKVGLDLSNN